MGSTYQLHQGEPNEYLFWACGQHTYNQPSKKTVRKKSFEGKKPNENNTPWATQSSS